jgi:mannose-6-phosphate isomerase-like protein (cupin superfamily)
MKARNRRPEDRALIDKISIARKFAQFADAWQPRIVAELNGQHVKLVRLVGEFVWHHHEVEDEMFLVVEGSLVMEFRTHQVTVGAGEFIVVPRGVEHRPVAPREALVMLFEPASTLNTGHVSSERTVREPPRI